MGMGDGTDVPRGRMRMERKILGRGPKKNNKKNTERRAELICGTKILTFLKNEWQK